MDWLEEQERKFTHDLIELSYQLQEARRAKERERLRREIAATIRLRRQVQEGLTSQRRTR